MTRLDAVDRFAEFVLGTGLGALPEAAVRAAEAFFLDTIAVGIAGSRADTAAQVQRAVADWGDGGAGTVLGSGARLPVSSAAFVNSFQIHCQEFDCLHEPATVHAMAVLTGALLAVAEERGFSGADLILGVALGVDVAANLGLAASGSLRFFRPATAGALGATAALARLERFDAEQFKDAWGLSYGQLAGTMQAHVEGSVALPLQIAAAARAAVNSIGFVRQGLGGPHDILEGPFGYFALFEDGGDLAPVLASLGSAWRVTELSHKPFPTGRAAHGTLDALGALRRERHFDMKDVAAINAYVPPLVKRLVDRPVKAHMTRNYARLCLQYLVPVFLKTGTIDTASFSDALMNDAEILEQGRKIRVVDDGNPDPNALRPQQIEVLLSDGTRLDRPVPFTLGSPENPLSREQRLAKFAHCLDAAGFGRNRAAGLLRRLESLEELSTTAELMRLVGPPR